MNVCAAMHVTFVFFDLIREENKIEKKVTSNNIEKLENQLFKERCTQNKIIDDMRNYTIRQLKIKKCRKRNVIKKDFSVSN